MNMEEDADDPMEIDDTVPNAQIIERKSDEFHAEPTLDANASIKKSKSTRISCKQEDEPDVVILDDDDEMPSKTSTHSDSTDQSADPPIKEIIDLVEKPKPNRCVNSSCSGENTVFLSAPDFCLSYFRVKRSKNYKEEICMDCYDRSVKDYDRLTSEFQKGNVIFGVDDYPIINETLQIEDSDEESNGNEEDIECIDDENFKFISENIEDVLQKTLASFDLKNHMKLENVHVQQELCSVDGKLTTLTSQVNSLRSLLDDIQIDLYNTLRPNFDEMPGLTIVDDYSQSLNTIVKMDQFALESTRKSRRIHKPVSYVELDDPGNSNSPKVASSATNETEVPKDFPPLGPVEKPALSLGEMYYISRESGTGPWIRARLLLILDKTDQEMDGSKPPVKSYKLVELKQQKERIADGKNIAYISSCQVRLPVGTRVIAVFKQTSDGKKPRHDPYYAGIVAEPPFEGNKYRYLIFFDIGYSQYVSYNNVHLINECSKDVWEDMPIDTRPFIKKYLESVDRPMVKLNKDQTVKTEYNGKWWLCTVMNVDCSLVQVFFDAISRMEWIYRGSTRLSPMFREEQAASNRQTGGRVSRKLGPNESATVVQYTRNNDLVQPAQETTSSSNVRAVARKSTTRPQGNLPQANIVPFLPQVNNMTIVTTGPTSKIMYFTPREQIITKREYKPHTCGSNCKEFLTHNFSKLRGHNPLSKPLLCGWARLTLKSKSKKEILYKAPCGRVLRNIAEVHVYLRMTKSEMTVDLFDFNHMVRCLAEFSVECPPDPKDLSRGVEQVPIPVINGISNEMLDFCNYSIKRVPMDGVHMNLDQEFLCGCDCEDDCVDKTKCSCWRLTLEGVKFIGKDVDPNSVGYIYRRLPEQVITGIYECNSRCKCASTCLNRVVQNPMSLKLQVFKTHNRGWGIRCLNDVPQGSFICIYAGTIHTEQMANTDGMAFGDEYFAELDYIEAVEKYKEDYEKEAFDDDKSTHASGDDDDDDPKRDRFLHHTTGKKRYTDDNDFVPPMDVLTDAEVSGIRTRLRKRNNDEDNPHAKESETIKIKQEDGTKIDVKAIVDNYLLKEIDTVTISDDEDEGREVLSFNPKSGSDLDDNKSTSGFTSVRELFGDDESVYVMDAKNAGNIGRFLNHSCSPNVFVQNVFVDTQDPRFPWVSFFSSQFIRAGTELTWNYNYDIGSVPGRVLYCHCAALECKGRLL